MREYFIFNKELEEGHYEIEGYYDTRLKTFDILLFGISKNDGSEEDIFDYKSFLEKYKDEILLHIDQI